MEELSLMQRVAVGALPLIFAITVHETAHGWVALRCGDPTARMLGRLTLNPIKHIDPIGTVIMPLALFILGGFIFGYAKPVPVTWENLRHPKRDMVLVALAGPVSNLLMAVMWAMAMKLGLALSGSANWFALPLIYMGMYGISINIMLAVLNLFPLPPLDGGRVMAGLLPNRWAFQYNRLEPWGFVILVGLLITGLLGTVLLPIVRQFESLLYLTAGL